MALGPRLELRTSQTLQLTPQLVQSIKLLQLNNLELAAFVEDELEKNPFLEQEVIQEEIPQADEAASDAEPSDWLHDDLTPSQSALETELDMNLGNVFDDDNHRTSDFSEIGLSPKLPTDLSLSTDDDEFEFDRWLSEEITLADHLIAQLGVLKIDAITYNLCEHIIGLLDERGYLRENLSDLAAQFGLDEAQIEKALNHVQSLEPTGVGARNLAECLTLQLIEKNRFDPCMAALLQNLNLLIDRNHPKLRKICNVDEDDFSQMLLEIKELNPSPGLAFYSSQMQIRVPDIILKQAEDGGWIVEMNEEVLPKLLLNQQYAVHLQKNSMKAEEKSFFTDAYQSASWLIRSMEARTKTILKVATEIVRQQDEFFHYGMVKLKPLTMKQIADLVELHESTISRVVAHKTILSPRGIFDMKFFFTQSVGGENQDQSQSAESIRWRVKNLVDSEDPKSILSDDAIVELLKQQGVEVARRTVAKYRDMLSIPPSSERRRLKSLRA